MAPDCRQSRWWPCEVTSHHPLGAPEGAAVLAFVVAEFDLYLFAVLLVSVVLLNLGKITLVSSPRPPKFEAGLNPMAQIGRRHGRTSRDAFLSLTFPPEAELREKLRHSRH